MRLENLLVDYVSKRRRESFLKDPKMTVLKVYRSGHETLEISQISLMNLHKVK